MNGLISMGTNDLTLPLQVVVVKLLDSTHYSLLNLVFSPTLLLSHQSTVLSPAVSSVKVIGFHPPSAILVKIITFILHPLLEILVCYVLVSKSTMLLVKHVME